MTDFQANYSRAVTLHRAGNLDEAIEVYQIALSQRPAHGGVSFMLGMALLTKGDIQPAVELIEGAASARPDDQRVQAGLASAYRAADRPLDAAEIYRRLLDAGTGSARLWAALGEALHAAGRLRESIDALERGTGLFPSSPAVHALLGRARAAAGAGSAALDALSRAVDLDTANLRYRRMLADVLLAEGEANRAAEEYRIVSDNMPGDAETLSMLGVAWERAGRTDEAEDALRRAADLAPADGSVIFRLGRLLARGGRMDEDTLIRWLEMSPVPPPILRNATMDWLADKEEVRTLAIAGDPKLTDSKGLARIAGYRVLGLALRRMIVDEPIVERALTAVRKALCELAWTGTRASPDVMALTGRLAYQCHYNEYVYAHSPEEEAWIQAIEASVVHALEDESVPDSFSVATLACYRSLSRLSWAEQLLRIAAEDHPSLNDLIQLQIADQALEEQIKATIPRLSPPSSAVSREVRRQYEDHPYPRWMQAPRLQGSSMQSVLTSLFPFLTQEDISWPEQPEILIAGCGTGLHSMITAQRFPDASLLAVDLSLASLAHAARRAREADLRNLEFAQCDILDLPNLGRSFDLIESAGVLHHMADPMEGWARLLDTLRPGGFMKIGLYSEQGRQPVMAARQFLEEQGFDGTEQGIRMARRVVMDLPDHDPARRVLQRPDFYATSNCRDLLFHVQEHRFDLSQIAAALDMLGLEFLGFELAPGTAASEYKKRYPRDPRMQNLDNWAEFEADHPGTFAGMYLFWARRAAGR